MPNFRTYVRLSREIIRAKKNSVNRFSQKTPAVGNSRGCAEQVAHRVCVFAQPRTPAAGSVCVPAHGSCFLRQGKRPRLRRAHLRWAIRAAAPSKSRTVSFSSPRLARPRLVPCASPRKAPVFPGGEKARACAGHTCGGQFARLRRASRAPCLFLPRVSHARGWFRVRARARLLFPQAGKKPAPAPGKSRTVFVAAFEPRTPAVFSEYRPTLSFYFPGQGEIPPPGPCGREETRRAKAPAHPQRTETPEKLELCSLAFRAFPLSAGGLRPEGPLSRPAARKRGRSAKGRRRSPYAQKRLKS